MLTDLILINQLQLPDLSDRQKAEILAEFLPLCNRSQRSLQRGFSETNCWGNGKIVGWWWRGLRRRGRSHIRKKPSSQLTESLKLLKNKQEFISFPVASELILPEIRTRQCRVPTINPGRETALPCPLYHSGAAGSDISLTTNWWTGTFALLFNISV